MCITPDDPRRSRMVAPSHPPAPDAPIVAWALWYADVVGWPIFPCRGKAPLVHNGFYAASRDRAQITLWWAQWAIANLATPMTAALWVLDIDPRHGGDETLRALEARYG